MTITTEPSDDELISIFGSVWAYGTVADGLRAVFRAGVATHNTPSREQIADAIKRADLELLVGRLRQIGDGHYSSRVRMLALDAADRIEQLEAGVATHNTVSREQIAAVLTRRQVAWGKRTIWLRHDEALVIADAVIAALLVPTSKETNDGLLRCHYADCPLITMYKADFAKHMMAHNARAAVSTSTSKETK